jgi:hypothetical protein
MLFLGHEGAFFAVRDPKKPVFGVQRGIFRYLGPQKACFWGPGSRFSDADGQKA